MYLHRTNVQRKIGKRTNAVLESMHASNEHSRVPPQSGATTVTGMHVEQSDYITGAETPIDLAGNSSSSDDEDTMDYPDHANDASAPNAIPAPNPDPYPVPATLVVLWNS